MNPITVVIQLAPISKFCSGIGVASYPYYGFGKAEIALKLGDLLNKDAGLRSIMQRDSSLIYGYPFNHFQSFTSAFNAENPSSTSKVTINLLGFINADLLGIIIGVQKSTRTTPTQAGDIINPLIYEEVADVELLFNGMVMHSTTGEQHKLTGMNSCNDPIYIQQSEIALPSTVGTGPFVSQPLNNYPLYIDFAQVRSMCFFREYENVWRISNNTLTLQLRTPNVPTNTPCQLVATYIYNGIIDTRAGETSIFFS